MSPKIKRKIFSHFQEYFSRYLFLIFLFFTGALCGVFSVSTLSEFGRNSSVEYTGALVQGLSQSIPDIGVTLLWSFLIRACSLAFLYAGGILCIGTIASFLYMLCFGFSMGFTVTLFFHSIGWKAVFILFGALLPGVYIFAVYLYASILSMLSSRTLRQEIMKRQRLSLRERARKVSAGWLPVSAAALAGILLESLVSPILMHFFARILV
ncbi:MAG: hypothetical protein ACOYU3_10755 [Bacillota bacterium]